MHDHIVEQVKQCMVTIDLRRHQLLVICEKFEEKRVETIANKLQLPLLNVNLILSTELKDMPVQRRPYKVQKVLSDAVNQTDTKAVCLDHIELCFEPSLKQDPIRLFEDLSRKRTLIVSWRGASHGQELVYAEPGHSEYVRSKVDGIVIGA